MATSLYIAAIAMNIFVALINIGIMLIDYFDPKLKISFVPIVIIAMNSLFIGLSTSRIWALSQ